MYVNFRMCSVFTAVTCGIGQVGKSPFFGKRKSICKYIFRRRLQKRKFSFSAGNVLMKFSVLEIAGFAMSKFDLFSDDCLNSLSFKTEYGRNVFCFSAKHTVPMRSLTHKIDVSLFVDLIALYMNP